jgi:DNA-binding MarR family transcriptional regulator
VILQERQQYAYELREMAFQLLETADEIDAAAPHRDEPPVQKVPKGALIQIARLLYRERSARARHFDSELFGEPAWDILLDIFEKDQCGEAISVSSACIAANVPSTTALRWITVLEKAGHLARVPSKTDLRVKELRLTDEARDAMVCCLTQVYLHRFYPQRKTSISDELFFCSESRKTAEMR